MPAGGEGEDGRAGESLKVEHEIVACLANFLDERTERTESASAVKLQHAIHGGAGAHQRGENVAGDPIDFHAGDLLAERFHDLQPVDDVAERGRLDDKDAFHAGREAP